MNVMLHLIWLAFAAALSACQSQPVAPSEATLIQARARLSADIQHCSKTYNFDPDAPGLPQRKLAPNELSWRQCAYEAVRDYEKSNPALAPMYNSLIDEDILMTNALMQGQMTRSERHAKIMHLLDQIKTAEQEQIDETREDQAKKEQQMRNMYDLFRVFQYKSGPY
jgi:hypothetical protein